MPNYKISKNIYLENMAFGGSVVHVVAKKFTVLIYVVGSNIFRPDVQKPRQMENAVRDI